MSKKRIMLGDQIRQAVDASGLSRYAICKALDLNEGGFSRFMSGDKGLTLANLEAVADLLDLHIVAGGNPRNVAPAAKPGRKPKGAVKQ